MIDDECSECGEQWEAGRLGEPCPRCKAAPTPPATRGKDRCNECNGELSSCGAMTEDGPLLDCRVCQLSTALAEMREDLRVLAAEVEAHRAQSDKYDIGCKEHPCPVCSAASETDASGALHRAKGNTP